MEHAVSFHSSIERPARPAGLAFFAALAVATIIPLVALPFYEIDRSSPLTGLFLGVWILAGYGHVLSTAWFGIDPDYKPLIQAHRFRMLGALAIIPAVFAGVALASPTFSAWLFAGFLIWQAHHFNRQNYGILCFAAAHERFGALPREVGWIINLTTAAGAIGMVTMPTIYPTGHAALPFLTPAFTGYARPAAVLCFAVAAALAALLLVRDRRLRRSPMVVLFLGLTGVFFLPSLLPGTSLASFWPYAVAHGAQYLVFMGITSRRSPYGWIGFALLGMLALVLGGVAALMDGVPWAQIYTGVVIWHFLADARLWRLSDPVVRPIVQGRFDFLSGAAVKAKT